MVVLSADEEAALRRSCRGRRSEHRDRERARIVLAAAAGASNNAIASEVGVHVDTVRKWRTRFAEHRLAGLSDQHRSGCPRRFTAVTVAQVKALACTLPTELLDDIASGAAVEDPDVAMRVEPVPLSRWSSRELAAEVIERGIVNKISATTVRRWLARDAIKPWQHRSWIFPRDPDFATKAARVLDLYARTWQGAPWAQMST